MIYIKNKTLIRIIINKIILYIQIFHKVISHLKNINKFNRIKIRIEEQETQDNHPDLHLVNKINNRIIILIGQMMR